NENMRLLRVIAKVDEQSYARPEDRPEHESAGRPENDPQHGKNSLVGSSPEREVRSGGLGGAAGEALPQFEGLVPHERIQLLGKLLWEVQFPDHVLNVTEIREPPGVGHPRGELEVNERRQAQTGDPSDLNARFLRVGETHRLGLAVTGVASGHEEFDAD